MKRYILALCSIGCLYFFTGCIKHYSCDDIRELSMPADTLLHNGATLKFTAPAEIPFNDVQYYNWYGPNHFSAHREEEAIIYNVTAATSGTYHLDIITKGGCTYRLSKYIRVIP